jgi:hypothetical protein
LDCALIEGARASATPAIKSNDKRADAFLQVEIKLLLVVELISFSYGESVESMGGAREARVRKLWRKIKAADG